MRGSDRFQRLVAQGPKERTTQEGLLEVKLEAQNLLAFFLYYMGVPGLSESRVDLPQSKEGHFLISSLFISLKPKKESWVLTSTRLLTNS